MSLNNQFCPNCSTMLRPIEKLKNNEDYDESENFEEGLYLECRECFYNEKTNTFSKIHFSKKYKKIHYIHPKRMVNDYIHDKTYSRTTKIECINNECSSRNNKNSEIILITSKEHPEIGYLCSECKNIWGKF